MEEPGWASVGEFMALPASDRQRFLAWLRGEISRIEQGGEIPGDMDHYQGLERDAVLEDMRAELRQWEGLNGSN